jgi:ribosomal protein L18E
MKTEKASVENSAQEAKIFKKISDEISERIKTLREMGISEIEINALISQNQELSRVTITKSHRIILRDFDFMEIKLEPLAKSVFLLFLAHPEGIYFKNLPEYKKELIKIYSRLSNRDDLGAIRKSIDFLTDPTSNSINEKCSRIKEAFRSRLDKVVAINYYITGPAAGLKRITLDRNLVEYE